MLVFLLTCADELFLFTVSMALHEKKIPPASLSRIARWIPTGLVIFSLVFAGGKAAGQTAVPEKLFLWEVKTESTTLYLFGSLHAAKTDFYPLPDAVEAAYKSADVIGVEADVTNAEAMQECFPLMIYRPPDTIRKHVSETTYERLVLWMQASRLNLTMFQGLRPAFLSSVITLMALKDHGYGPESGIDLHFIRRAKEDGKSIVELESLGSQMQMLGGLTDEEGEAMLLETIKGVRSGEAVKTIDHMADVWKKGDVTTMARLIGEENKTGIAAQMFKKLFEDRNAAMAEKITGWLTEKKTFFIVVGAGHLAGRASIINLLRAKGYQVRQLP